MKAGIMEGLNFSESAEGTPQGGVMSPTLGNIALDGLEKVIKNKHPPRRGISPGVHVIRYADDIIITSKTQEIATKNKEILADFLAERGLKLSEDKTAITHIKSGFDFLGFNIQRKQWDPKRNEGTDQETVLVIKPSKKGINKLTAKVNEIIDRHKPLERIIAELNPVLRG